MAAVVADTHALLWYLLQPERLSAAAKSAFVDAAQDGDPVYLSAISLVEIRYLIEKAKLVEADLQFLINALNNPVHQLVVARVDYAIALEVGRVPRHIVPDMPDRIIAATALSLDVPLVTRDQRIRQALAKTIW